MGPLSGPGHIRRVAPFAAAAVVGVACISINSGASSRVGIATDLSALVTLMVAFFAPWSRLPRWTQGIVPLMCSAFTYPALHLDGGLHSPALPLIIAPVLWLIMFENAVAFSIGLGSATAFVAFEMLEASSRQDVLRGVTSLLIGCLILPKIRLVVLAEQAHAESLTGLADRDALTGLANRRVLDRRLAGQGDTAHTGRGLIFIDLNDFKRVNDELGHDAGDRLLIQVAGRITDSLRGTDFAARIGGDEFVVACDGGLPAVRAVAARVDAAIRDRPFQLDENSVVVTASVGVSHTDNVGAGSLLRDADEAMYRAKRRVKRTP